MTSPTPFAQVIGDPIAHSKSPVIHGFWLEKLGIEGEYGRAHVKSGELSDYLSQSKDNPRWTGCNVTMPHKQAIIPLLDRLHPLAKKLGAVNTVVRAKDGGLVGYNTDGEGFLEPLRSALGEKHLFRMARVLGTGGAARAIIAALEAHGFTLVLAGRDPDKARALLDELAPQREHHAIDLGHFAKATDFEFDDRQGCFDLIVNASPLGMTGNPPLPFDWSHAPPDSVAYDIVTSPLDTPFLQNARAAGHQTIDGFAMLIGQAATAFEKFFNAAPPREYDAELVELLAV
ncbi:shikimate dehydrogenase [Erythrobacter longus]|uniref:Shikimate dehydrogenase (NADP(+)) n=1 Tax=Erythrobacter longus TaxID=1044 RepID=A0A074M7Q8_ERYLO|nr:shikimate dehydrogenase [Erythrobacter longus]KEO89449.1 shikimate dehydrogenase [Erythrobacter longus]